MPLADKVSQASFLKDAFEEPLPGAGEKAAGVLVGVIELTKVDQRVPCHAADGPRAWQVSPHITLVICFDEKS